MPFTTSILKPAHTCVHPSTSFQPPLFKFNPKHAIPHTKTLLPPSPLNSIPIITTQNSNKRHSNSPPTLFTSSSPQTPITPPPTLAFFFFFFFFFSLHISINSFPFVSIATNASLSFEPKTKSGLPSNTPPSTSLLNSPFHILQTNLNNTLHTFTYQSNVDTICPIYIGFPPSTPPNSLLFNNNKHCLSISGLLTTTIIFLTNLPTNASHTSRTFSPFPSSSTSPSSTALNQTFTLSLFTPLNTFFQPDIFNQLSTSTLPISPSTRPSFNIFQFSFFFSNISLSNLPLHLSPTSSSSPSSPSSSSSSSSSSSLSSSSTATPLLTSNPTFQLLNLKNLWNFTPPL
ncbi:hypothetical protein KCV03_g10272, partial [Aureobasidium melanogenum]